MIIYALIIHELLYSVSCTLHTAQRLRVCVCVCAQNVQNNAICNFARQNVVNWWRYLLAINFKGWRRTRNDDGKVHCAAVQGEQLNNYIYFTKATIHFEEHDF